MRSIRTPGTKTLRTLVAAALILVTALHHRAYAQEKAEERNKTSKTTKDKTKTGTVAGRDGKRVTPGKNARKSPAIPEPTVALKPGEVPIIEFESLVFDFGRVRAGTAVQHDFVFTNAGNGTLEILKAKAG